MIPEILDTQEQIGADPELQRDLRALLALMTCSHAEFRYAHHDGGTDPETGCRDSQYIATCGEQFFDEEIEQELARQAESGGDL